MGIKSFRISFRFVDAISVCCLIAFDLCSLLFFILTSFELPQTFFHLSINLNQTIFNMSAGQLQPFKISLTPSSDRPESYHDFEGPTTPTSSSGGLLFGSSKSPLAASAMTPIVSSTCASVDSDSDYQVGGSIGGTQSSITNTPSRPMSRNSVMSGMSTTATKDGVEGNRIHRFHDPQGYTKWISSTMPDDDGISFTSSSANSRDVDDSEEGSLMMPPGGSTNGETERYMDDNTVFDMAAAVAAKARIEEDDAYDYYAQKSTTSSSTGGAGGTGGSFSGSDKLFSKALFSKAPYDYGQQDMGSYSATPPNDPSAPPVTLNEKIRLLRTGTVSRHPHIEGTEYTELQSEQ